MTDKTRPQAGPDGILRCPWCLGDAEYTRYHDEEWGEPLRDSRLLFELFLLEGAQAGLSWLTILKRRGAYRAAFGGGEQTPLSAETIARYTPRDVERLMACERIIRNRRKIGAFIQNSRAFLSMEDAGESFSGWLWDRVDGAPLVNRHRTMKTVPARTPLSEAVSRGLKEKGFVFAGPVITYSLMQSAGLINDHLTACFKAPA